MYKAIHQRLKEFIEFKKFGAENFGKKFNAKKNEISNWTSETKMNMYRFADMLVAYPELNANWLLTGKGEMLNSNKLYNEKHDPAIVNDVEITNYSCTDCISKQNEIDALKQAIEAKDELLDMYREKKTKCV